MIDRGTAIEFLNNVINSLKSYTLYANNCNIDFVNNIFERKLNNINVTLNCEIFNPEVYTDAINDNEHNSQSEKYYLLQGGLLKFLNKNNSFKHKTIALSGQLIAKLIEKDFEKNVLKVIDGNILGAICYSCFGKAEYILLYKRIREYIPKQCQLEVFNAIYSEMEYGFSDFYKYDNPLTIDELYLISQNSGRGFLHSLYDFTIDDNYITVFRGECTGSTKIDKALSWTLSKDIAISFANRFLHDGEKGKVYTAKIKVDNILSYIEDREEQEVLVDPSKIEILKVESVF